MIIIEKASGTVILIGIMYYFITAVGTSSVGRFPVLRLKVVQLVWRYWEVILCQVREKRKTLPGIEVPDVYVLCVCVCF